MAARPTGHTGKIWAFFLVTLGVLWFGAASLKAQVPRKVEFDEAFEWVRRVQLEETERVLTFQPRLSVDPQGDWLVVDPPEGQVRLYGRDGELRGHFGRTGEGPGEFHRLVSAFRQPSGALVTVDATGRVALWSSDGREVLRELRLPLVGISAAGPMGGDSMLVLTSPAIPRGGRGGPVLHVIDVAAGVITRSFYEPTIPPNALTAWVTILGGALVRRDGVWAVSLPLLDSLLLWDGSSPARPIPLGLLADPRSIPDGRADRAAFMRWTTEAKAFGGLVTTRQGWLVPLLTVGRRDNRIDLLVVSATSGERVLVVAAPILVGSDAETGEIIFQDPDHPYPGMLRTARLR